MRTNLGIGEVLAALVRRAREEGRKALLETEGLELLERIGIQVPAYHFVRRDHSIEDIDLKHIRSTAVVVKVVSPEILHKSDVGGIRIVPCSTDQVNRAIAAMQADLDRFPIEGFLVLEKIEYDRSPGGELLAGLRWAEDFGPVLTFGAGGVFTEYLNERLGEGGVGVASASAAGPGTVAAMVARSSVAPMIDGSLRNQPPRVDPDTLHNLLQKLLEFGLESMPAQIREFEINPLVLSPDGPVALDVLISLGEPLPAARPEPPLHKIGNLLHPRSIGIIGVSSRINPGRIILKNTVREGFDRSRIYVVKPGLDEIEGCRCVPDIAALPEPVDLFILAVDAAQTPAVVEELVRLRSAESLIVIPGGMEERNGSEEQVGRVLKALIDSRETSWQGPVINGGNCLGVRSKPGNYDTLFIPDYKLPDPPSKVSSIAMISQSGAFAVAQASKLGRINPKYLATIGNQTDLTAADYLTYLKDDSEIQLFACYVEGFKPGDGLRWLEAAREITRSGRTVLLYRAGRTTAGAQASASHTASIAGDYQVTRQLAVEAGAVVARSLAEFDDLIRLFTFLEGRKPAGNRLGALSNAGFECVAMADSLGPFQLADLDEATCQRLAGLFRACRIDGIVSVQNPLDLTPIMNDELYEEAVKAVLLDPGVDVGLVGCVPLTAALNTLPAGDRHTEDMASGGSIVTRLGRLKQECDKPWVAVVDAGRMYDPMAAALTDLEIPTFRTADRALRLLSIWNHAS
jgi:acyl-CoA synthetase (NDP forming)